MSTFIFCLPTFQEKRVHELVSQVREVVEDEVQVPLVTAAFVLLELQTAPRVCTPFPHCAEHVPHPL